MLGLSQAIEAGLGIGFVPCFIGDRIPGLVRLLTTPMTFDASLWLLTHPDLRHAARSGPSSSSWGVSSPATSR